MPVEGDSGVVAVLALYRAQQDGFRTDHVRVLLAVAGKLGFAIQSFQTQDRADGQQPNTDALTGLPNLRALHAPHLEGKSSMRPGSGNRSFTLLHEGNTFATRPSLRLPP